MKLISSFKQFKYKIENNLSVLTYQKLVTLSGKSFAQLSTFLIMVMTLILGPRVSLKIFPKSIHAFLANLHIHYRRFKHAEIFCLSAITFSKSVNFATSMYLDLLVHFDKDEEKFKEFYDQVFIETKKNLNSQLYVALRNWVFWNGDLNLKRNFLEQSLQIKNELLPNGILSKERVINEFTTNFGHEGCFYFYLLHRKIFGQLNEYEFISNNSTIPNKYYLDLILDKFDVRFKQSDSQISHPLEINVDSLFFGIDEKLRSYRFEADASHFVEQSSPEWNPPSQYLLNLDALTVKKGYDDFQDILGGRWFVILHIKEPKSGTLNSSQSRDSILQSYDLFCQKIFELGGIVVRMGDKRFPPAPRSIKLFDYAYSDLQSDLNDCWLWSQCEWWTGNVNGAAIAPLTFGKSRVITNQWHWTLRGGSNDLVVPKVLVDPTGKILNVAETVTSKHFANQNRQNISKHGFEIIENDNELLADVAIEMYEKIILRNHNESDKSLLLKNSIKKAMSFPPGDSSMMISNAFAAKFADKLMPY